MGVLGCVLLSPNDCIGDCIGKLRAGAEVFYDLRHQTIYGALLEMYDAREAIDLITLQQRLKDRQLLEQVGGLAYLSALPDTVPERREPQLLPRLRSGKISASQDDPHLHRRRRAHL